MPRGVPHSYLVRSERARALVTFSPAGFEQWLAGIGVPDVSGEPEPAPVVHDSETLAHTSAPFGLEIVGPPPSL